MQRSRQLKAIIAVTLLAQLPSVSLGATVTTTPTKSSLAAPSRLNPALFAKNELIFHTQNYGKYFAQLDLIHKKPGNLQGTRSRRLPLNTMTPVKGDIRIGGYLSPQNKVYMGLGFQETGQQAPHPTTLGAAASPIPAQTAVAPRIGFEHQFLQRWSIASELQTQFTPNFSASIAPRKPRLQGKAVLLNLKYSFE